MSKTPSQHYHSLSFHPTPLQLLSHFSQGSWNCKSNLSDVWIQADTIRIVKEVNKTNGLLGNNSPIFFWWMDGCLCHTSLLPGYNAHMLVVCNLVSVNINSLKWEVHSASFSILGRCATSSYQITVLFYPVSGSCRLRSNPWRTCLSKHI